MLSFKSYHLIFYIGQLNHLREEAAPTLYNSSYDPVPIMRAEELKLLQAEVYVGNSNYSGAEGILYF